MAIVAFPLRDLRVYAQTNATFSTKHTTDGDFDSIPFVIDSATVTLDKPVLDPNTAQQYKHGIADRLFGPTAATLEFAVPLAPTGTLADDSTASLGEADYSVFRLLSIVMGGERSGDMGSTVSAVVSASSFTVATGEGSRFAPGGACAWLNASSKLEVREVESVATDLVTVKHAFSAAPQLSDAIYNATTFYLDDGVKNAQFIAEGAEGDDKWTLYGANGSVSIETPLGEIPKLVFSFTCANWVNEGSGSLVGKTYPNYDPMVFVEGEFLAQTVGTVTRNIVDVYAATFEPQITYGPVKSVSGMNTINNWIQLHSNPVIQGTFSTYFEDTTWYDARDNTTKKHLSLQLTDGSSSAVAIVAPSAQITEVTFPEDAEGIAGHTVSFVGGHDTDATDQTTALRRSPLRIHFVG